MSYLDRLVRRILLRQRVVGRRAFLRTAIIGAVAAPTIVSNLTRPVELMSIQRWRALNGFEEFWFPDILEIIKAAPTLSELFAVEPYNDPLTMPLNWELK